MIGLSLSQTAVAMWPRKRRLVLIHAIALSRLSAIMPVQGQLSADSPLPQRVKIPPEMRVGRYYWVTPNKLIADFTRSDDKWRTELLDLNSGRSDPLPDKITDESSKFIPPPDWSISPDGLRLLKVDKDYWVALGLDGREYGKWALSGPPSAAWMPGSVGWIEFSIQDNESTRIDVHWMDSTHAARSTMFNFPKCFIRAVALSPDRTWLCWLVLKPSHTIGQRGEPGEFNPGTIASIWISTLDGTKKQVLANVRFDKLIMFTLMEASSRWRSDCPGELQWRPDGKQVTYLLDGHLWAISVPDADRGNPAPKQRSTPP